MTEARITDKNIEVVPYVEIAIIDGAYVSTYRFYGLGVWRVKVGDEWRTINGIMVPAEALHIAANEVLHAPDSPK